MGQPRVLIEGTGPWMVTSLDPTSGIELAANPHYWGGKVNIRHISIKFFADQTSEALAFRAGAIDVCFPEADARGFASASGARVISKPAYGGALISMNPHVAPWNDIHVRRAVAYAINRTALVAASGDPGTPTTSIIPTPELELLAAPAQVDKVVRSLPAYPYNLAKARAEMAKSAYPHGFKASTDSLVFGAYLPEAEVVAAQLAKIGVDLKVNTLSLGAWLAEVYGPKTYGFLVCAECTGWGPDPNADAFHLLASKSARTGGWNPAGYTNPAVDALISEAVKVQNKTKRLALYAKLMKIVATDVVYVPAFLGSVHLVLSPKFKWTGGGGFNQRVFGTPWALDITSAAQKEQRR
jgi:peptide/nickel transport system substrate-binding protein